MTFRKLCLHEERNKIFSAWSYVVYDMSRVGASNVPIVKDVHDMGRVGSKPRHSPHDINFPAFPCARI